MTNIDIFKNKEGIYRGFKVSGHSNYSDYGYDILCSAISVLTQTTLLSMQNICMLDEFEINYEIEDGLLSLFLPNKLSRKKIECTNILFKNMLLGLDNLSTQYPNNMVIRYEEVE